MTFSPGEEADELRSVVRAYLAKHSAEVDVRRLMEDPVGHDPTIWRQLARELGLHGLAVPPALGGSGAGPVELGVVFEELGAALYCGPFLATVGLAASALLESGDVEAQRRHLPGIVAGDTVATMAWAGDDPAASTLTSHGRAVFGHAPIVVDGVSSSLLVVSATTDRGPALFIVDAQGPGVQRAPLSTLDQTRRLAEISFDGAPATPLTGDPVVVRRVGDLASLYLAAEQLGGAAHVLAATVDYARTRIQFGRPIGSFQAIKHRLADLLVAVESARSAVHHGLWVAAHERAGLSASAALARAVASDAFRDVATQAIQIHGGIGFTWEHWAHLHLKRAKSSQLLLGSPTRHRARLAGLVGVSGPASIPPDEAVEPGALDAEISAFLAAHPVPPASDKAADRGFREARFDAGLAIVAFDPGLGGLGADPALQIGVEEQFDRAGAPDHTARNVIGLGMAMPTIHTHGTAAQRARYLRPCFSGEEIWCQLFSEPGAGSDLASLATRAVPNGDGFRVDGQKVWTSLGHVADYAILLARTDPDAPKHRGLTFFLLDMRTPGVVVRPLRQLTGEAEFNEVYLTDVHIPADHVLGEVGDGWRVAMTTLANERVSIGSRPAGRGEGPIAMAVRTYRDRAAQGQVDAAALERLMLLWCHVEAARLTNVRAAARPGHTPGPEGSIAKLQTAELNKAVYEFCVDHAGSAGLLIDGYDLTVPTETAVHGGTDARRSYLRSLANSIEGGTSEVLRTILGERVLGLPGEPRTDRDLPWKDLRRS